MKKIWIKDGKRKMMSDSGHMFMKADTARKIFGKLKGGKYSLKQEC
jgi:hypothetical protein